MIPHTVAGIAVLMAFSPKAPAGALLTKAGLSPVNSHLGIILACMFVSIPFYVDAARDAFYGVSPRIERAARTLGAPFLSVFFRVSLPLARKGLVSGLIMSWARSVSEFGAVVIIAYHPMVAPTLIYDRFATFGLKYSTPVAVQLGISVPAKTPAGVVKRLSAATLAVNDLPAFRKELAAAAHEPMKMEAAQFEQLIQGEYRQWGAIIPKIPKRAN